MRVVSLDKPQWHQMWGPTPNLLNQVPSGWDPGIRVLYNRPFWWLWCSLWFLVCVLRLQRVFRNLALFHRVTQPVERYILKESKSNWFVRISWIDVLLYLVFKKETFRSQEKLCYAWGFIFSEPFGSVLNDETPPNVFALPFMLHSLHLMTRERKVDCTLSLTEEGFTALQRERAGRGEVAPGLRGHSRMLPEVVEGAGDGVRVFQFVTERLFSNVNGFLDCSLFIVILYCMPFPFLSAAAISQWEINKDWCFGRWYYI